MRLEEKKENFSLQQQDILTKSQAIFWGFQEKNIYRFDVNEIQFTFQLAFDKKGKPYPALFNAYPCGWWVTKNESGKVRRTYKDRFNKNHISENFRKYVERGKLSNEKYIRRLDYDFEYYEYCRVHKFEPILTNYWNFKPAHQSIEPITQSCHESTWTPRRTKPHLIEVTVVQLSIPLLHETHHQNPLGEVDEQVQLHSTSIQKLNTQDHNQNTANQARE